MKFSLALAALALGSSLAHARPPLNDPVFLNIGYICRWQQACIVSQQRAMERALTYVKKRRPAAWKVQQCNLNASRKRHRTDWIGFDNCIRNRKVARARKMI